MRDCREGEKEKKKRKRNGTFLFRLAPKRLPPWGKSVSSSVQIVSGWSPDYFWQAICFGSTPMSSTLTSVAMQKISTSISRDTLLFLKTTSYLEAELVWATLAALPCARTSITKELLFTNIPNTYSICSLAATFPSIGIAVTCLMQHERLLQSHDGHSLNHVHNVTVV